MLALSELDHGKLLAIEEHINKHHELVTSTKCCYSEMYKEQEKFSFLPGHKATVLGIAEQVKRMKNEEFMAQKRAPKPKKFQSENALKCSLVCRLAKYSTKLGFPMPDGVISERNIRDFKHNNVNKTYRCVFSCPFCDKTIPIIYKTFWMTSNATTHVKFHVDKFKQNDGISFMEEEVIIE